VPGVSGELYGHRHVLPQRPEWYGCACCPPNMARLIASLGKYAWGENERGVFSHIFVGGSYACEFGRIACDTEYPWGNIVRYKIFSGKEFTFAIHVPAWCKEFSLAVNGEKFDAKVKDGYVYIERDWKDGDEIKLTLGMKPRRVYANTNIRADAGCVALMYGPVVYCFEEKDNGKVLSALRIPRGAELRMEGNEICLDGRRMISPEELYGEAPPREEIVSVRAVPYYSWGNRGHGEMRVWMLETVS